jgi:hypothetical protein
LPRFVGRADTAAGEARDRVVDVPPGTGEAQAAFRDELVALMRESAEASWREMRRGVEDFDAFTRPDKDGAERAPGRPYRVKP